LIAFAISFILLVHLAHILSDLQQAQKKGMVDQIQFAFKDLSRATSMFRLPDDYPRCLSQPYVDKMRTVAVFLMASMMNCFSIIINCLEQNGFSFPFPF
jgi:hypothetical protein